ncbi:MAG: hypothetical protein A2087_10170 [Spirochaetes bacterium GWD1_61_31]|nr:MAG: hypothetical protein A2Y37_12345 [Spirochaetes bacterium GWB1_60_80]OHD30160.1 MAG: hypothetical protein A2004_14210 [Spirochaetes bacterium GWC1_61_12]OHD34584.1 MAG: hypothetical protein A2087_10170 [Spirochaetes bacterium GWD1_61_31]OHD46400.1 MAG: hypothetical protein A2Y35_10075 [Spirochaetes bacterium GWE1_60_18]OHD59456.1 MAG: hypothetical protein A2Y32_10030 [Spirochaetes bacterium GWF1_60_12]HAP43552.1 hypothetical protein [Spirochaetaceae bacterium]
MAFVDQMKAWIDKGLAVSKEALANLGDKAHQLGEKGVLKMEISQLRSQIVKQSARLGMEVYDILVEKGHKTVSRETTGISEILDKIKELDKHKDEKEAAYGKIGGKEEDLDKDD